MVPVVIVIGFILQPQFIAERLVDYRLNGHVAGGTIRLGVIQGGSYPFTGCIGFTHQGMTP
jgi:hypothetical protein